MGSCGFSCLWAKEPQVKRGSLFVRRGEQASLRPLRGASLSVLCLPLSQAGSPFGAQNPPLARLPAQLPSQLANVMGQCFRQHGGGWVGGGGRYKAAAPVPLHKQPPGQPPSPHKRLCRSVQSAHSDLSQRPGSGHLPQNLLPNRTARKLAVLLGKVWHKGGRGAPK